MSLCRFCEGEGPCVVCSKISKSSHRATLTRALVARDWAVAIRLFWVEPLGETLDPLVIGTVFGRILAPITSLPPAAAVVEEMGER